MRHPARGGARGGGKVTPPEGRCTRRFGCRPSCGGGGPQHQQTVLEGGGFAPLKGHDFIAAFVKQAAAPSAISVRVGPGAEPVVGLTGHGVLQKVHVLAAEGLVQHLAAAQNGAGTAGIVVTVKYPQLSVVQPGSCRKADPRVHRWALRKQEQQACRKRAAARCSCSQG